MSHERLVSGVAVLAVMSLSPAAVSGQTPAPAAKAPKAATTWSAPKTPWGDPDLQGMWTHYDATPLETPDPDPVSRAAAEKALASRYSPEGKETYKYGNYGGMSEEPGRPVPPKRRSLVVEPPSGRIPILPGKVVLYNKELHQDTWETHNVRERCITNGQPASMFAGPGAGRGFRILQSPGWVVFFPEQIHDARAIPVDGRPHVGAAIRLWDGDPVGRWEGQTLVVETTNYNNDGEVLDGIPQTDSLRVVERFTRTDAKTITHEMTFEDPKTFSAPWKVVLPQLWDPTFKIYEFACHEGNFNYMEGSLRLGRFRDRLAEEAAKKTTPDR